MQFDRIKAAAKVLHAEGVAHGWFGLHYTKSYEELEKTDPIGYEEFNAMVERMLQAAISPLQRRMQSGGPGG